MPGEILLMKNLITRVLIAVIFIPLILYISYFGRIPFMSFVNLLIFLGLIEFSSFLKLKDICIPYVMLILSGLSIGITVYFYDDRFISVIFLGGILIPGLFQLVRCRFDKALENLSSFLFGLIYVALFFSFLILIREFPHKYGLEYRMGGLWIIFLFLCTWCSDILSYFIGTPFGKHKILPQVSPNKSWEGSFGGISGALLAAFISKSIFFNKVSLFHLLSLAVLISIFGQIGDFVESSFKRQVSLKDSSSIIPGHGGILDRFDSLLFSAPLVYFYLRFILYR
jgi:phosphatidate cytidylyltransferase